MEPSDFKEDRSGTLVKAPAGYRAFVPHPLPPRLDLDWDLAARLSEADRALSELSGTARNLPNPQILIGPFVRKEAVFSSRIEGTQASFSDLLFFEAARSAPLGGDVPDVADVEEVHNYVRATVYGLSRLKELPVSLRLLLEVHRELMKGVRGQHLTPGEFRRSQNWIGPPGCSLMEATFVPPPEPQMKEALGELEKFLHSPSRLPPLVRMALVHYQFEAIHPFQDGNGRIGRLLIPLLLFHEGLLPHPLLYLSAFFERRRDDYYRLLLEVSRSGAWLPWIDFFLLGVKEQAQEAMARTIKLLELRQTYRRRFESARSSAFLLRLVDELFEVPVTTIARTARRLKITPRSAALNISKLVGAGVLVEATGRRYNRVFHAPGVMEAIGA